MKTWVVMREAMVHRLDKCYVDAETEEEARKKALAGDVEDIYDDESLREMYINWQDWKVSGGQEIPDYDED